uniref:Uncharacterized protein n=1 Tax=Arundo donax TaxID=35708 RepID=A0A0A9FZ85_ARUDO
MPSDIISLKMSSACISHPCCASPAIIDPQDIRFLSLIL